MHYFILLFWCFDLIIKTRSEEALLYNLKNKQLDDIKHHRNRFTKYPALTACPPSTDNEKQFNDEFSITGNSIFLRDFYQGGKYIKDIPVDICDKPLKPAVVYDSRIVKETLIGYELYYDDGKVNLEGGKYDNYKPVKKHKVSNANRTNTSKLFVTKLQDWRHTKFKFVNGSSTLVFHWIPVLTIKSISSHQKRIYFKDLETMKFNDHPADKCENYNPKNDSIDALYSEENQAKCLKDIIPISFSISENTNEPSENTTEPSKNSTEPSQNTAEFSCGNPYGCLEKYPIIPLWYFNTSSAKIASCSDANTAPAWKSITEHLTKVDQYFYTLMRYIAKYLDGEGELFFGVAGVLSINKTIPTNHSQEIHLSDPDTQTTIPIPKIFYRIIHCGVCVWEKAAIIIHNDPEVSDSERLCAEGVELEGWEAVKNTHKKSGLTYVCRVTKHIDSMLGSQSCKDAEFNEVGGLNLNMFSYQWKDATDEQQNMDPNWLPSRSVQYQDMRFRVNRECDILFDTHITQYKY